MATEAVPSKHFVCGTVYLLSCELSTFIAQAAFRNKLTTYLFNIT